MRITAERTEVERKRNEKMIREGSEREALNIQEKLDRQKSAEDRKQALLASDAQSAAKIDANRKQRVMEVEALKRQREMESEEQQRRQMQMLTENAQKAEIAKKQQQEQRSAFAANLFSRVSLSPQVSLSATAKRLNLTVELRGKDLDLLRTLLQQRNYLRVINYLNDRPYIEYPTENVIEASLQMLNKKEFALLVETTLSEGDDKHVYVINPRPETYRVAVLSQVFERHPDGIGFLHPWRLSDGPVFVMIWGKLPINGASPVKLANHAFEAKVEHFRRKFQLGEIGDVEYNRSVAEFRKSTYESILKWAAER